MKSRPYCVIRDFSSNYRILEYDFGMSFVFYVQIANNPQPCKIDAEKIVEQGMQNGPEGWLLFKNEKDEVVGTFRSTAVIGWWKVD
jgi:hypothetical protein